jgi:hypothetical protein
VGAVGSGAHFDGGGDVDLGFEEEGELRGRPLDWLRVSRAKPAVRL